MTDYENVSADEVESLNELAKLDGAGIPSLASEEYLKKVEKFDNFGEDAEVKPAVETTDEEVKAVETQENENAEQEQTMNDQNTVNENMQSNDVINSASKAPVEEPAVSSAVSTVDKQESKPNGEGLAKTAEVFGMSKAELEDEFKRYKANRLFSKVILDLTDVDLSYKEALRRLGDASAYNIYSAIVLPNFVTTALKSTPNILLNVAVGYPYGVETLAVKKYMVKQAVKRNVSGVVLYIDTNAYKEMKKRVLAKELKKLKKSAKKKNFAIAVEISKLTTEELQTLSSAIIQAEITEVVALPNSKTGMVDEYALIRLCGMAKDKFNVIASAPVGEAEKVINFYEAGIARFACENAVELAKSFKQKLGV